jgi:L-rhamnose-H+ transport protein
MEGTSVALALLLVTVGGIMEGAYSIPLKYAPRWEWKWENMWGAGSLVALLLVPWPLAFLTVPNLLGVLRAASAESVLMALLFGGGWGVGGIFFGLGIASLGLSLGLSLIMGLVAIGGSIVPLMMKYPEQLLRPGGLVLIAGIVIMLLGLVACAWAGQLKDKSARRSEPAEPGGLTRKVSFKLGLFFCVASGLTSALVNFGLIFGAEIAQAAVRQGASPSNANNAIWALVFTSNYIVNIAYCVYLMKKNHSFANFSRGGISPSWAAALYLGVFWAGGIVVYGIGATRMGRFGAFLGYPVMLIVSILTGNGLGVLTGEWKGVPSRSKRVMTLGVFLLMFAIGILAYSSRLIS